MMPILCLSGQTFPKKGQYAVVHYVGESDGGSPYKDLCMVFNR